MSDIVPYGFTLDLLPERFEPALEGTSQGVFFTFEADRLASLLEILERWFEARDEVILVDYGTTDKQGLGCIVMEWEGCEVDILFQDILRTDPMIIDYTIYEVEI